MNESPRKKLQGRSLYGWRTNDKLKPGRRQFVRKRCVLNRHVLKLNAVSRHDRSRPNRKQPVKKLREPRRHVNAGKGGKRAP